MKNDNAKIVSLVDDLLLEIVDLHIEAFHGYMNSRLGRGYVLAFLNWFCKQKDAIALAAVNPQNKPVGYVVGAPVGYEQTMNRDLFWIASIALMMRPWLFLDGAVRHTVAQRFRLLLSQKNAPQAKLTLPEPVMSLVGIGVASSAAGQGIGTSLMLAFETKAVQLGMTSMRLSVYPGNLAARRLYEKNGWRPFVEQVEPGQAMYYSKMLFGS